MDSIKGSTDPGQGLIAAAPAFGGRSESAEPEETFPDPPIRPFFTLIEDTTTGTTHHPQVHYIFSDEDSDALIDSIARVEQLRSEHQVTTKQKRGSRPNSHLGGASTLRQTMPQERCVVVNMAVDGTSVTSAWSLTSDWQILDATVSNAPMLDGNAIDDEDEYDDQRRLMLKVVGTGEIGDGSGDLAIAGDGTRKETSIEDEVKRFAVRMAELGTIVKRAETDVMTLDMDTEPSEVRM